MARLQLSAATNHPVLHFHITSGHLHLYRRVYYWASAALLRRSWHLIVVVVELARATVATTDSRLDLMLNYSSDFS